MILGSTSLNKYVQVYPHRSTVHLASCLLCSISRNHSFHRLIAFPTTHKHHSRHINRQSTDFAMPFQPNYSRDPRPSTGPGHHKFCISNFSCCVCHMFRAHDHEADVPAKQCHNHSCKHTFCPRCDREANDADGLGKDVGNAQGQGGFWGWFKGRNA